jgi:hypothetical protein
VSDTIRATIIVDSGRVDDLHAADAWLSTWRSQLAHVSDNKGCGCCVHIWEIEGPRSVIERLPSAIRGSSSWDQ